VESIEITCIICGAAFEFTVDEQLRYQKMNFDEPRRCPDCRKNKLRAPAFQDKKFNHRRKFSRNQFED
jgi:DNA-directed RNA polymerase subunit RPC12/RpoP